MAGLWTNFLSNSVGGRHRSRNESFYRVHKGATESVVDRAVDRAIKKATDKAGSKKVAPAKPEKKAKASTRAADR